MTLATLVAALRRADGRGGTAALVSLLLAELPASLSSDCPIALISVTRGGVARVSGVHDLPEDEGWRTDASALPGAEVLRAADAWHAAGAPHPAATAGLPAGWPAPTAAVALRPEGVLGGVLYVFGPAPIEDADLDLLRSVAAYASLAMERDRVAKELRRSDRQMGQMVALTAAIGRELDFPVLAQQIVDALTESMDFRVATITLRDDGTCRRLAAAGLPDPRVGLTTPSEAWTALLHDDWRRGTMSYLVPPEAEADWSDVPDIAPSDDPDAWNADNALVLPLTDGDGEIVGFLSVDEPRSGRLPTDRTIEGLELFARQVQVAFVNAQLYTELRRVADRDSLTGLWNRRVFWDDLAERIPEASSARPLSLAVLDVDDFKRINDTHGHAVGDDALRHVADRLQRSCRETDRVYRIGGEEFVIVLPDSPLADAHAIIDRARAAVRASRIDLPPLTISAGVATVPLHAATPDELFAAADAALLHAKRDGKDSTTLAAS